MDWCETEIVFKAKLKMKETVTIIVSYGSKEDKKSSEKDDFWEKLNCII